MKATYCEFLNENPKCGKNLATNETTKIIFALLSRDENIIAMIDASDAGKPALTPVVTTLEDYYFNYSSPEFNLAISQIRSVIGCMIKTILSRFGYTPVEPASRRQKELSNVASSKHFFMSGSCYKYDPSAPATMTLIRKVTLKSL